MAMKKASTPRPGPPRKSGSRLRINATHGGIGSGPPPRAKPRPKKSR